MVKRLWQNWPAENNFYCDGRFISGKNKGPFYGAVIMIVLPTLLFWTFTCRGLFTLLSPAILLVSVYTSISCLAALFICGFIDPGILPRKKEDDRPILRTSYKNTEMSVEKKPTQREIQVNGQLVTVSFCETCNIWRPPRCSHCSFCDNCILNFDHHCPWVGNCVGKRNYRFFYLFVILVTFNCLFDLAFSVTHLVLLTKASTEKGFDGFLDAVKHAPVSVGICVFAFFAMWSIAGLSGFHTYLICIGQSTYEDTKDKWESFGESPFHQNCIANFCYVLCPPQYPSALTLRGVIIDEDRASINKEDSTSTLLPT